MLRVLIEKLAKALVENPESVTVSETSTDNTLVLELRDAETVNML